MLHRFLKQFYISIMEMNIGAILLALYYWTKSQTIPLLAYYTVALIGAASFSLFLNRYKDKGKVFFLVITVPILFMVGLFFELPPSLLGILSILIFWRGMSILVNPEVTSGSKELVLSLLIGMIILFFTSITLYEYTDQILYVIIFQIFFIIVGRFIINLIESNLVQGSKKTFLKYLAVVVGFLTTVTFVLSMLLFVFKFLINVFITSIGWSFALIASPLLEWLKNKWTKALSQETEQESNELIAKIQQQDPIEGWSLLDIKSILIMISILALIVGIYYLYKRKKFELREANIEKNNGVTSLFSKVEEKVFSRKKKTRNIPTHPIRIEIYELEHYANKLKIGRNRSESLSDWFRRIGLDDFGEVNEIYEKIRYGEGTIAANEEALFIKGIRLKKNQLKEIQKIIRNERE